MKRIFFIVAMMMTALAVSGSAQTYSIEKSVIANGGGTSSGGGFSLTGTIAQPVAGSVSGSASPQAVLYSGFWTPDPLIPTAAGVSISGRIVGLNGSPVSGAFVRLMNAGGDVRTARVNQFGRFHFESVQAGDTYIIQVTHRTLVFQTIAVSVQDSIADMVITSIN